MPTKKKTEAIDSAPRAGKSATKKSGATAKKSASKAASVKKAAREAASATKEAASTAKKVARKAASTAKSTGRKVAKAVAAPAPVRKARAADATAKARRAGDRATGARVRAEESRQQVVQDYQGLKRSLAGIWQGIAQNAHANFNQVASRIEKQYNEARKTISEVDVRYALEKTQGKLKTISKSGSAQVQQLGRQVKLLYMMLRDAIGGRFTVPWATIAAVTSALLYFISPIDVVPDFIPGAGLIDDALVIALAFSVSKIDLRRYVQENELNPEEYGLK